MHTAPSQIDRHQIRLSLLRDNWEITLRQIRAPGTGIGCLPTKSLSGSPSQAQPPPRRFPPRVTEGREAGAEKQGRKREIAAGGWGMETKSEGPNLLPVPRMGPGCGAAAGGKSSAAGASGGGESGSCCRRLKYKKERGGASRSPAGKLQAAGPDWARRALNKHRAPQGCQSRRPAGPQRGRAGGGSGRSWRGGGRERAFGVPAVRRGAGHPARRAGKSRGGFAFLDARVF